VTEKNEQDLWMEILQRLVRIEENTKGVDEIANKAKIALAKSEENERDINEIKENQKWTWRTIAGIGVSVIVYFITRFLG
jgi:DNA-binding PucR family transcriptional regulator